MKKILIALVIGLMIAPSSFAQTSSTETVLRTLQLPAEYAPLDGYISDYTITRNLVIVKNVDNSKSVKTISSTGKVTYSNAPTTWGYETKEVRNELDNSGTYLPNYVSMQLHGPKTYINPDDIFEIKTDRINPTSTGNWIAASSLKISQLQPGLIMLTSSTELGGSNNVIPRIFVKRVGNTSYYKNPVDYLGRPIIGDTLYNQGAPASAMKINFENRLVSVSQITKTAQGSGSWSSNTGVWSGGVKIYTSTTRVYVPVSELPGLFGNTIAELEHELRTEIYCTQLNRNTHITSTSTEVVVNGNQYDGTTYYSGIDASITKPSGKITSYNKPYPGHVQRWILKQWNQDGTVVAGSGALGQIWMNQFSSSESGDIKVVPGNANSYDSATKTLTYDASKLNELWYSFEELPAQGKNWGGETIIKL